MGAPRSSEGDRLTHRVQLPFEYDEGHETNNDEYGAEAQVGKEVAREITWARQREWDEDRAQASEEGPAPCKSNRATKGVPAGPKGRARSVWAPQSTGGPQQLSRRQDVPESVY